MLVENGWLICVETFFDCKSASVVLRLHPWGLNHQQLIILAYWHCVCYVPCSLCIDLTDVLLNKLLVLYFIVIKFYDFIHQMIFVPFIFSRPYLQSRLCCSVVSVVCVECIVSKSYYWKPIWVVYKKSIGTKNEWPWPLFRGRLRSCERQPLHHIRRWISRKPLEIKAWFQWTTDR